MVTYPASEEGPVYQSDLWSVAQRIVVAGGMRREARLVTVQVPELVGVGNLGVGVEVLQNSGSGIPEKWEVRGPPLVLHRPEVL